MLLSFRESPVPGVYSVATNHPLLTKEGKKGRFGAEATMTVVFNRYSEKWKRRYLRDHMTHAEIALWTELKSKRLGVKFRRQYGVEAFVLDFYCPEKKLAIEVDGISHDSEETRIYDRERQEHIEKYGITFLRFTDQQVFDHIEQVLNTIEKALSCL